MNDSRKLSKKAVYIIGGLVLLAGIVLSLLLLNRPVSAPEPVAPSPMTEVPGQAPQPVFPNQLEVTSEPATNETQ